MNSRYWTLSWLLIVLVSIALRVLPMSGGLPYIGYVDEATVLHPVIKLLKSGGWDPHKYNYGSLNYYLILGLVYLYNPIYYLIHGHFLQSDLPQSLFQFGVQSSYYDLVSPPELIVLGRIVVCILSIGTVALSGALAHSIGGRRAGITAAFLAALCPALVTRGSIVIVDSIATFFSTAAFYFMCRLSQYSLDKIEQLQAPISPMRDAVLTGFMIGLAFVSKYTAAAVLLSAFFSILFCNVRLRVKFTLIMLCGIGFLAAGFLGMPALFLRFPDVLAAIKTHQMLYIIIISRVGYIRSALSAFEVGVPLAAAAFTGIIFMLVRRGTRNTAISWIVFGLVLGISMSGYSFKPFRNMLPLVPLVCVSTALLLKAGISLPGWRRVASFFVLAGLVFSLIVQLTPSFKEKINKVDSRVELVNWLKTNTQHGQKVLVVQELAVLPSELEQIHTEVQVAPWQEALDRVKKGEFHFVVTGLFDLIASDSPELQEYNQRWKNFTATKTTRATFGKQPTKSHPYFWRGNDQLLRVIEISPTTDDGNAESQDKL